MLKLRRSRDRLIFNMGIPIPGKDSFYIGPGSSLCWAVILQQMDDGKWVKSLDAMQQVIIKLVGIRVRNDNSVIMLKVNAQSIYLTFRC